MSRKFCHLLKVMCPVFPTVTLNEPASNRIETLSVAHGIFISATGTNCARMDVFVNGVNQTTRFASSLAYNHPVFAPGTYHIFVEGTSNTGHTARSVTRTVTVVGIRILSEPGFGLFTNQSTTLRAETNPPNAAVTWSSSAPNIARVVPNPDDPALAEIITYNNQGTAVISATSNPRVLIFLSVRPNAIVQQIHNVTSSSARTEIDGLTLRLSGYNINGNNFFRLRDIATMVSRWGSNRSKRFNVEWDEVNRNILLTKNTDYVRIGGELELRPDGVSARAAANASPIIMNGSTINWLGFNINGFTYFRLRDVMRTFNIFTDWDQDTQTILLDTTRGYVLPIQYDSPYGVGNLSTITSPFGYRMTSSTSNPEFHAGFDLQRNTSDGAPLLSIGDNGVVVRKDSQNVYGTGLGHFVVIRYNDPRVGGDFCVMYAHLQHPSPLNSVSVINRGTRVGNQGRSGAVTTGSHLHIEAWRGSTWADRIHPTFGSNFNLLKILYGLEMNRSSIVGSGMFTMQADTWYSRPRNFLQCPDRARAGSSFIVTTANGARHTIIVDAEILADMKSFVNW